MTEEMRQLQDFPDIMTAQQVAEMLHMSLDYVRKLSREGKIPSHKLPGGSHFRYFKDEIVDWLRSQPQSDHGASAEKESAAKGK